ncbi:MAG: hypothetical protein U0807_17565 [Candidatus Binatia bacterium]
MRTFTRQVGVALGLVLVTVGCSMRRPGFPRQSYDEDRQIEALASTFERPELIHDYYDPAKTPPEQRRAARDRLVTGRMALIDLNYDQFVSQFASNKQAIDTATEVLLVGVNLATTAVGGEGAKTVLAAAATGITSGKVAIDKNYFYEQTVPVLVVAMNAQRKETLAPILDGLGRDADAYPLTRALSDLDRYYFAGTFLGALQAIQADAGAKEKTAEVHLTEIRNRDFFAKEQQMRVAELLDRIDALPDASAIGLEKAPPVAGAEVDQVVRLRDPGGQRLVKAAVARLMLKTRVALSGRSAADLDAWAAALTAVGR